ncbi:MAG: class I SAM-dependent methyltransferase [Anaerolineales bacterium]|nr:class I SAM-dependent methyltransferase [Anaerolineales bacterium]
MKNNDLKPALTWGMTDLALLAAKKAMENRANVEMDAMIDGKSLVETHGQAVRDYVQFEQLIGGAFDFLQRIKRNARGVAIDLGSGTGVGACILSRLEGVENVYAVEFSEYFVEKIMPVVFEKFEAQHGKIQRVVGDFNRLDVADGSVNILLDIDSLHHSEDLDTTLKECDRVLDKDGIIIAIDRAWPDRYTQEKFKEMLDRELPDQLKQKYGIPPGQSFTRRDFGEHEYTIRQWFECFERHGFEPTAFLLRHPPTLNRIWLRLPTFKFSMALSSLLYRLGFRRLWAYGFATTRVMFVCTRK